MGISSLAFGRLVRKRPSRLLDAQNQRLARIRRRYDVGKYFGCMSPYINTGTPLTSAGPRQNEPIISGIPRNIECYA
jgi:hypothetical protein